MSISGRTMRQVFARTPCHFVHERSMTRHGEQSLVRGDYAIVDSLLGQGLQNKLMTYDIWNTWAASWFAKIPAQILRLPGHEPLAWASATYCSINPDWRYKSSYECCRSGKQLTCEKVTYFSKLWSVSNQFKLILISVIHKKWVQLYHGNIRMRARLNRHDSHLVSLQLEDVEGS